MTGSALRRPPGPAEHPYLEGYKVRIVAVLKNGARPDLDIDGPDYDHISR